MKASVAVIAYLGEALAVAVSGLSKRLPSLGAAAATASTMKADIDLLQKAWSDMAVRNLLGDIQRAAKSLGMALRSAAAKLPVAKGAAAGPDSVEAALDVSDDLVKRIERELGKHAPSRAGYTKAVLIGYKVKVTGAKYSGLKDDAADMQQRCKDLIRAIQAAYALADRDGRNYNADGTMLKIFVAPEFFFRGRNGAYDHGVVHGLEQQTDKKGKVVVKPRSGIVELMRGEIDKPAYKDWLFVLGTAIAASEDVETTCTHKDCKGPIEFDVDASTGKSKPRCSVDRKHKVAEKVLGAFVENVAFVVKEGEVQTVSKELVSHVDFVGHKSGKDDRVTLKVGKKDQKLTVERHDAPSGYKSASNVPTKFTDERMGGCVFTVDGVTIGLEVCLDHAATKASNTSGRLAHSGNIQIQLIPSAGMTIGALRTVQGGIVFNVDGATPHVQVIAGVNPEVHLNYDQEYQFANATWTALKGIGADLDELKKLAASGGGKWVGGATAPPVGPAGAGSVLLYGPYDIPAV